MFSVLRVRLYGYKQMNIRSILFTLTVSVGCVQHGMTAEQRSAATEKPRWEFGAGLGGQYLPDYRGSDQYRSLVLPFPMFRYRGDFLKVDEESVRGELFNSERLELNVSADTSLVIGAKDNKLREGMPDLLPAFEVGPSLIVTLAGDDNRGEWTLHLPLRIVGATDLSKAESVGLVFNPYLAYERQKWRGGWNWLARFGLLFADSDYHGYYYAVDDIYANPQRPAFEVEGGYSGAVFKLSLRKRVGQLWLGGTLRFDFLADAEFEDSPLLESDNSFALSLGMGWFFE